MDWVKRIRQLALLLLLVLGAVLLLVGCLDDEDEGERALVFANEYRAEDSWLVYWYVCGTDLESEMGAASSDLEELQKVQLPENVKVLIQTGGTEKWQNDTVKGGVIGRYLYDKDGLHELEQAPDADMGAKDTLAAFLRYGKEKFAADHRVFVFWDHGGGSAAGVCKDERTGHALSLNDIRGAFTAVHPASESAPPFELIGFDACLMAAYDVAGTLQGLGRYMTASEELEPGNGWNYAGWVGALGKNPAMGGAALGQVICDTYMKGCRDYGTEDAATMSVIDLGKMPELRKAYEAFGLEALRQAKANPYGFFTAFGRGARQAENYGGNTRYQGFANMVDLGDLAQKAGGILPNTANQLVQAIDQAVIYKVQGDYRNKGRGLSSFYSYDGDTDSFASYAAQQAAPLPQKCLYHYLIYGQMPREGEALLTGTAPGHSGLHVPQAAPKQKLFKVDNLEDLAVDVDAEGNSFVKLTREQMDMLASIHCQLVYMDVDEDILLYLGSDANIDADWEKGIFKDNFQGTWPMLDGHPVFVEITAEEEGYNIYSVPIKLNGVECNLQVTYTFADKKYHILGARRGIDSQGMGDRNLIRLKAGDQITTLHYGMTISGDEEDLTQVEVDTFTIGDQPKFAEEDMGDGVYGYCFEFVTPAGDSALSKLVQFTIQDGKIVTAVE
ncbi:putative peptidase C11 family protein [Selenomonas ruminantium subsp. lactilytica TAM6421]|uniref:Putative peptidase C11 family protein n=1 Tax=Selenomonas ruminantium subsp. lactilytica (strain NBRC 103574 / TAM6421) TaxID=927704 RepID=I0GMG3_SELRL|nr:clostripain-related cysteine peptidase [Selenomonas ruminantium]BAL81950.1 putative peptidase C11 family protein [Selenomonas ruminantium subsp. lactilytica TAM6421]